MNATIPDRDAAFNTLYSDIHNRVFFNKLASAGYVPENMAQAQAYLDMGEQLLATSTMSIKQAADANDPVLLAKQALDNYLGVNSLTYQNHEEAERLSIQKTAAALAQNPEIYNAVLVLKAAEAAELDAQARR